MATAVRCVRDMTGDTVRFRGVGYAFTATAGATTNGDYLVTSWGGESRVIDGAQLLVKDHVFGDYVHFQIVDVDNRLGYGAGVILDDFGTNWYLDPDTCDQGHIRMPYLAELVGGLYIRVVYVSTGGTNVGVKCNLFLHKPLV